jgi:hypothetical protein
VTFKHFVPSVVIVICSVWVVGVRDGRTVPFDGVPDGAEVSFKVWGRASCCRERSISAIPTCRRKVQVGRPTHPRNETVPESFEI